MSGIRVVAVGLFLFGALMVTNLTIDFSNVVIGLCFMIGAALVFIGR